ncbi:MAG: HNH endonuclease [Candidatus Dormibacteraeota bacterium]|nr:HNH endonuclease [Candidatus Dormibacteraeota bacterium]
MEAAVAERLSRAEAEALERRACELAAHVHAATAELSQLLATFAESGVWTWYGVRSCADWFSLAAGLSIRTGSELIRVGHALRGLPKVAEAFGSGRLSFDKVRAITQVATGDDEHIWVEMGLNLTASQLARVCRDYRLALEANQPEQAERRLARRGLWSETTEDGMMRIVALLPLEEGELVLKAIEAARQRRQQPSPQPQQPAQEGRQAAPPEGRPDAPVEHASSEPRPCLDDELDRALVSGPLGALLQDPDEGLDPPQPIVLDEGDEDGDWGDADLDPERDAEPLLPDPVRDPAEDTFAAGRVDGLFALARQLQGAGAGGGRGEGTPPYQVVVHVDVGVLTGEQPDGRCELESGMPLSVAAARRLGCDCEVLALLERDGLPIDVGRRQRRVPRRLRRALEWRDKTCRFPGCMGGSRRSDDHHLIPWYLGGPTDLDNLLKLCPFHHQRLHDGIYRIVELGRGDLRFETGAGREIGVVSIAVEAGSEWGEGVRRRSRKRGLSIDAKTPRAEAGGERLDRDHSSWVIWHACERIRERQAATPRAGP